MFHKKADVISVLFSDQFFVLITIKVSLSITLNFRSSVHLMLSLNMSKMNINRDISSCRLTM